jgi:hypothetical protein
MRALGRTPLRLNARVDPQGPQLTSSGVAVTALGAGRYQVVATDRSKRDGFRLVAANRRLQTGVRYRGTARWTVRLEEGEFMRYGSIRRGARKLVPVLGNGFDH